MARAVLRLCMAAVCSGLILSVRQRMAAMVALIMEERCTWLGWRCLSMTAIKVLA